MILLLRYKYRYQVYTWYRHRYSSTIQYGTDSSIPGIFIRAFFTHRAEAKPAAAVDISSLEGEESPLLGKVPISMDACCKCLAPSRTPLNLTFANAVGSAIGDMKIPSSRRLYLGIIFPEDVSTRPLHMFFSMQNEGTKVLESACAAAGLKMDRGRIIGSPDRLNLFTLEGDLLRLDLDLEAHIPYTLQPNAWIVLEKGNRIDPTRLGAIREAAAEASARHNICSIM